MKARIAGLVAVLLLSLPAASSWAAEPYYMAPAEADLVDVLGPPPAPGSDAAKADMDAVMAAQKTRTPADEAAARADNTISVFDFATVLGPDFAPDKTPFATAFFQHVLDDGFAAVGVAKDHFARTRPFGQNSDLHPLITIKPTQSYPSGHASFAYLDGILLADMVPEKAPAIFTRAAEIAQHRVVAGVHFPTDIQAGRISASVIDNVLLHDAKFMADYDKAKAEVRHAVGLP
jgi:acid phosphatase (class A)